MTGHDRAREYIRSNIDVAVRSGYGDDLDLYIALEQQVLGEFYNQSKAFQADELAAFRKILFESVANQQALESTWNDVTMNDRISAAFAALNAEGIIALEDAGYTTSDGWGDVAEVRDNTSWGATFFHRQDVERGVRGDGLLLAFGAFVEGDQHESESVRVGTRVCQVLGAHGVATEWLGTVEARISIPSFPWQRRRWTTPPAD